MEKYHRCLLFDNHDGQGDYPHNPDNYFFGIFQNFQNDKGKEACIHVRRRMLIVNINQSIIDNFQSQADMALFVLETLNNEKGTIYLN
ncbi:MAG: hypothetical protein WAZ12_00935 [Candidatus Absconditicoccaceae bacterium]